MALCDITVKLLFSGLFILNLISESVQLSDERRLIKHLIKQYEEIGHMGRPVHNTSETVTVKYGLALIQILDLDEKNQILTTNVWNRYQWHDTYLEWDPEAFCGIDHVRLPISNIWTPDIVPYNNVDPHEGLPGSAAAVVSSDGSVLWIPQAIMRSSCSMDTTHFPFDELECTVKFASWTYDGFRLDLEFYNNLAAIDTNDYIESNGWEIVNSTATRNVKYYPCCLEPYPNLVFTLNIKRNASFYSYILVLPSILLSALVLVTFLLPPESSEKITLGTTVFVSFFVLLLILAESVPRAASSIPLIGAYFFLNMTLITLSVFLSLAVSSVYLQGQVNKGLPKCLKQVFVHGLAKIMCTSVINPNQEAEGHDRMNTFEKGLMDSKDVKPSTDQHKLFEYMSVGDPRREAVANMFEAGLLYVNQVTDQLRLLERDVTDIRIMLKKSMGRLDEKDEQCQRANEWRIVARVLDRIFFLVYLIIFIGAVSTMIPHY